MKTISKIKKKFTLIGENISNMSSISKNLLRIGQPTLFCILLCLVTYLYYFYNFSNRNNYFEIYNIAFTFFDNIIAGVCVLWGGAMLLIILKNQGNE